MGSPAVLVPASVEGAKRRFTIHPSGERDDALCVGICFALQAHTLSPALRPTAGFQAAAHRIVTHTEGRGLHSRSLCIYDYSLDQPPSRCDTSLRLCDPRLAINNGGVPVGSGPLISHHGARARDTALLISGWIFFLFTPSPWWWQSERVAESRLSELLWVISGSTYLKQK